MAGEEPGHNSLHKVYSKSESMYLKGAKFLSYENRYIGQYL